MSPGDKKDVLEAAAENKNTDDKPEEEAEEAYDPLAFALASIMGTEGKFDVRKSPVKPINPLRDVRVSFIFFILKTTQKEPNRLPKVYLGCLLFNNLSKLSSKVLQESCFVLGFECPKETFIYFPSIFRDANVSFKLVKVLIKEIRLVFNPFSELLMPVFSIIS